jgi:hypothetical protein
MGRFLVFSVPAVTFSFQILASSQPLHRHVGLILIFLEYPVGDCACVHGAARLEVCLFRQCSFCHIHREYCRCTVPSVAISFRPGFHDWTPKSVFSFDDRPDVVSIPYTFELLWNTLHIWDIHRAQRLLLFIQTIATLGINDRVNETLGMTVELETTSQADDCSN